MIEIKVDTKELVESIKEQAQKVIKNEINEYSIWDSDEITEEIDNFFKNLTKEVLNENKEKYKKMVEEQIKANLDEIVADIVANTIR
jgi:predicted SprT family Zn-dependent metalloprotease